MSLHIISVLRTSTSLWNQMSHSIQAHTFVPSCLVWCVLALKYEFCLVCPKPDCGLKLTPSQKHKHTHHIRVSKHFPMLNLATSTYMFCSSSTVCLVFIELLWTSKIYSRSGIVLTMALWVTVRFGFKQINVIVMYLKNTKHSMSFSEAVCDWLSIAKHFAVTFGMCIVLHGLHFTSQV